jgi:GDP-L-fucose synthase
MAGITTILVTGGSGLVGRAVQWVVENSSQSAPADGNWVFLSSSDGDLR